MRIHVRLRQKDRQTGEEKLVADASAVLNGSRLMYKENDSAVHVIDFGEDEIILRRKADFESCTVLRKDGIGESLVKSEYGTIRMETLLDQNEKNNTFWLVGYQVISEGETVLDQILIWDFSEENPLTDTERNN